MNCCQRCKSLLVRYIPRVGWVCSDCGHVAPPEGRAGA